MLVFIIGYVALFGEARVLFSFYWRHDRLESGASGVIFSWHDQEFSFLFMDGAILWTSLLLWQQGTRVLFSFYGRRYRLGTYTGYGDEYTGFLYIETVTV